MQAIYGAGRDVGIKQAERQNQTNGAAGSLPHAHMMAVFCHERLDLLQKDYEREFIVNMVGLTRRRSLSPKQRDWLERLHLRLGGSLS
jgi:hypothetical protein